MNAASAQQICIVGFPPCFSQSRSVSISKLTNGTAMGRLKLALVPMLASGKPVGRVFDQVFR
ncbi:hypothetical protein [Bradyrhizobium sp. JYMT SZCCT0428]|uniref:hypothetical protein n=1 Tax=Bradyrhizobium sp. JYMT SZCCT0428 TaxID=2807673 RepID=UPI001BADF1BB|nr:hypothetical protein [Bradyrhizobium sp. JYMT SZCCT0428]MBR1151199.1 hypothetical protein [Bradyrhizobium sp. JYMT SZCCT0428]